jgi:hypothetical protein
MPNFASINWSRVVRGLSAILIVKVTLSIVWVYRDYFPPNFASDFLLGREAYFWGPYRWAFYAHLVAGPPTLVFGLILLSNSLRRRFTAAHRALGKVQVALVLLLLTPSGLWMARYAGSLPADTGFATLALATAACTLQGWRTAMARRFADHRRWMVRSYLLLCSAVVLRLIGGLAAVTGVGQSWSYPLAAWASWLVPLAAFEAIEAYRRGLFLRPNKPIAKAPRELTHDVTRAQDPAIA